LNLSPILLYVIQLTIAGGVPSVFLLDYVTKGLFLPETEVASPSPQFPSEYHELMWLKEKQMLTPLSEAEMLRFYELRDRWPAMHRDQPEATVPSIGRGRATDRFQSFNASSD
jgi:hypothetical protein